MAPSRISLNEPLRALDPIMAVVIGGVTGVIEGGSWLHGPEVAGFEAEFSRYCSVPFCLAVANGTDGLELALRAAGAEGREVVTTANAGGYTTTACRLTGAMPVYVDVTSDRLAMNTDAATDAITDRTRVIVVTHLYGNMVDVQPIRSHLARAGREDIVIVEDASQAHGARLGDTRAGAFGDISVFSFYPTKNLGALGDAGAVLSRDEDMHDRLVALHQYGWAKRHDSVVPSGRNSRMDEIQASVLRTKLPYLDSWNQERRAIVAGYERALEGTTTRLVTDPHGAAHLGVVMAEDRDELRNHLDNAGIDTGVHFPVLDPDQRSQRGLAMRRHSLEVSERSVERILTIPVYPGMPQRYVERVVAALHAFHNMGGGDR